MAVVQPQAAPPQHRQLTAIMMADMVGYSRMLEIDEPRNSDHAAHSVEVFKSLIGAYGGQVVNVAGDGVLSFFDSAEAALRFAVLIQSEFREQAFWEGGEPIRFRIGVNVGQVVRDREVVQAHCVNVAARIQSLAEPGSIVVTGGVLAAVHDLNELTFRSIGRPPLKNILEEIEVFAVDAVGDLAPKPPLAHVTDTTPPIQKPSNEKKFEGQPAVAVLAFTNLTGDGSNEYFSEGFVEGIISDLSRFRSLTVIARHSTSLFSLKTRSAGDIGRSLRADYLLAGSLQRVGKKLRVVVELIDANSEAVIWSDRFSEDLDQLFEIQDEITGAVSSRLTLQIDFAQHRIESQHRPDLRSYGLVLRGQQVILRVSKEANSYGRGLFEEAMRCSPLYARAYSASSRTHNLDWRYSWSSDPAGSLEISVEMARGAIELDCLDAHAFAELGFANLYRKRLEESLSDYARALALNPNDADVIAQYADALNYAGQPAKAVELLDRAMRLNPYHPDWYLWCLADAHDSLGQPETVIATVRRMRNPDQGRRLLAANLAHLGLNAEARAEAGEIMRLHPTFRISSWSERLPYRDRALLERFAEGLRLAGLPD